VTVEDNGIGIPATDMPHIFGRFCRADPESRENAGSTFRIAFPLFFAKPQPKASPAADALTTAGPRSL
jgi:hypothetical protein